MPTTPLERALAHTLEFPLLPSAAAAPAPPGGSRRPSPPPWTSSTAGQGGQQFSSWTIVNRGCGITIFFFLLIKTQPCMHHYNLSAALKVGLFWVFCDSAVTSQLVMKDVRSRLNVGLTFHWQTETAAERKCLHSELLFDHPSSCDSMANDVPVAVFAYRFITTICNEIFRAEALKDDFNTERIETEQK